MLTTALMMQENLSLMGKYLKVFSIHNWSSSDTLFSSGTTCSFTDGGLCEKDSAGFQYYTDKSQITCIGGSQWDVVTQQGDTLANLEITTPVCSAQPCEALTVDKATSLECSDSVGSKLTQINIKPLLI